MRKFCKILRLKTTNQQLLSKSSRVRLDSVRFEFKSENSTRSSSRIESSSSFEFEKKRLGTIPSSKWFYIYIVKSEVLYQRPHVYHGPLRPDRQPAPHRACARGELDEQGAQVEDVPHQRPVQVADELGHPGPGGGRAQVHHKQGGREQERLK